MTKGYIQSVHPVLPVRDVVASLRYYKEKLGFEIVFADDQDHPMYAGVKRDGIEIHLQCHDASNWKQMNASSLRFVVKDIEALSLPRLQKFLTETPCYTEEKEEKLILNSR